MMDRHRHIRTILSFGFLTVYAAFYAAACGDGPPDPSPTGGGNLDSACIPSSASGPVASSCGVFASSSAGSDDNPGTKEKPVQTLAKAVSLAKSDKKTVYACAETFVEAIEVAEGISIFGGLDCAAPEWAYVGATTKTVLAPEADKIPLTIVAGEGTARFEDLAARAADATLPSGSSIAALVNAADATFTRCELTAGAGATGEVGLQPTDDVGPADQNDPAVLGNNGAAACMGGASGNGGGEQKVNAKCSTSIGGMGGTGQETVGEDGADGMPFPEPNPENFGVGGIGSTGLANCKQGESGASGTDGLPGAGASADELGTIDIETGYVGATGKQGTPGTPGQGGGGGGGAKGKPACFGASGGSGGAGGCGGNGGLGGKGGGSSFAVLSLNGTLKFTDSTLTSGAGGKGGDGGSGQAGGVGGNGGKGGTGSVGTNPACEGGRGGQGGPGGMGGGGRGGHSAVIAYKGAAPELAGATPTIGAAGPGGTGADAASTGAEGVASNVIEFK
jgi:hypothetical protein